MRNILKEYSPSANFWEANPQFTVIPPFSKKYKSDKSRGKKVSSDIMWTISLVHFPKSDAFYVPDKEYKIAKAKLGLSDVKIDLFWTEYEEFVEEFCNQVLSNGEKSLVSWESRLKQRDAFLSTQEYHFAYTAPDGTVYNDNTKQLDDMNSKTGKFYDEYRKIQTELAEDQAKEDHNSKGYSSSDVAV